MDNIKVDVGQLGVAIHMIYLAQDRDQSKALVNTVMNFGFNKITGSP
jgi:hypothetical protein